MIKVEDDGRVVVAFHAWNCGPCAACAESFGVLLPALSRAADKWRADAKAAIEGQAPVPPDGLIGMLTSTGSKIGAALAALIRLSDGRRETYAQVLALLGALAESGDVAVRSVAVLPSEPGPDDVPTTLMLRVDIAT